MNASENKNTPNNICEDCGATVTEGKVGCRKVFEEVIALQFSDYRYGKNHRLTVDIYSLQHPDEFMRSGKSFAAHLTGMCAALEYEDTLLINQMVQQWLSTNPQIEKPVHIPKERGNLTISYIQSAADAEEVTKRVNTWAREVWAAWSEHHALARQLITEATIKE